MMLSKFQPGDRITMTSGPHKGKTGKRDRPNLGSSTMILVKFDGEPSFSMVQDSDQCEMATGTPATAQADTTEPKPKKAKAGKA